MNKITIINSALAQLKTRTVMSLTEETEESIQAGRFFELSKQYVLRQHKWGFARKVVKLALTAESNPFWHYLYAFPAGCITINRIYNRAGYAKSRPDEKGYGFYNDCEYPDRRHGVQIPFEVFYITDAVEVIATNMKDAYADFIYDIKNTGQFPPDFTECLIYYLASELATVLTGDAGLKQQNLQLFQLHLNNAIKNSLNQSKPELKISNPFLQARL